MSTSEKSWQPLELIRVTAQFLAQKKIAPARLDAEVLLAAVLNCSRLDLYARHETVLTPAQLAAYREFIRRRVENEPVSRILGKKEFMGFDLLVTPDVLSPRPETEILVEQVLKILDPSPKAKKSEAVFKAWDNQLREFLVKSTAVERGEVLPQEMLAQLETTAVKTATSSPVNAEKRAVKILELGTGSGCIAIALAKNYPLAEIVATDISDAALNVARQNAARQNVAEKITFIQSDWFAQVPPQKFDLLIANPPYIASDTLLMPEVKNFDPPGALFAENAGLASYEKIIGGADKFLATAVAAPNATTTPTSAAYLIFEVGAGQATAVAALIKNKFPSAEIIFTPDYASIDRVVTAII